MTAERPEPIPIADMVGIYADMGFTLDDWLAER